MRILEREFDSTKIQLDYNKVAWFYNLWSRLTESKAAKYVIESAEIKNGETILEIACGTGVVFEQIVKRNPNGKNTGIDLSPAMLDKAKKRLSKLNNANYKLIEADALNLNFKEETFNVIINNFMIDLMPVEFFDKLAKEFYRLLKSDGIVVLSTFSFGKKKINKIWIWIAKRFPGLLTGCRPVSFREYLINAGFEIEKDFEISQNTFPSEVIKARKKAKAGRVNFS